MTLIFVQSIAETSTEECTIKFILLKTMTTQIMLLLAKHISLFIEHR